MNWLKTYIIVISLYLVACTSGQEKAAGLLSSSKGAVGEVILVIDSTLWADTIGIGWAVRKVFLEEVPCLPQPEPMFTLRTVRPHGFNALLKECRNIVMVTTFDLDTYDTQQLKKYFSEESIQKLSQDTTRFMLVQDDQFATNQKIVHLFGRNADILQRHLLNPQNRRIIQEIFNQEEKKRVTKEILEDKGNLPLAKNIAEKYGFRLHIPSGFVIAKEEKDFIWLRHLEARHDRSIIVHVKNYIDERQFSPDSILAWRAYIGKTYLREPDNPNYYMTTETLAKPLFQITQLNGQFAHQLRGLWRLKDRFVGGVFIAYATTNQKNTKIYYIEGFNWAVGLKK
ncbi:MAG: DUF4837 family protein, partial [Flammeovirgaceae bacterium]|nr:DUF4837 family protein [Flammeovirgaceae bacterium]MDW8288814.1 DUF4837 family protein [Flammeovirgaceae bacterium]